MPAGITSAIEFVAASAGAAGTTADVIGTIAGVAGPAILGAGVGAAGSAITGGNIGKGAILGGVTGGVLGGAGEIASGLGLTPGEADLLKLGAGAAGGAAGSAITGAPIGTGALIGGISGGIDAALSPTPQLGGANTGAALSPVGGPAAATGAGAVGPAGATAATLNPTDFTAPTASFAAPSIDTTTVTGTPLPSPGGPSLGGDIGGATASITSGQDNSAPLTAPNLSIPSASSIAPGSPISSVTGGTPTADLTGAAPAAGTSSPSLLSKAGSLLTSHPGTVLGAGVLGLEALNQPKLPSISGTTNSIADTAAQFASQGNILASYINNGTLPPGAMQAINTAATSAKAALRSKFAADGMTGSTAEATALSQVDQQVAGQVFQTADTLLTQGINESGLSADLYKTILATSTQQQQIMMNAIATFASSIAGGGKALTLNLGNAA